MKYCALVLLACAPLHSATLTIEVSNIQSNVGPMNFMVYASKDTWLGDEYVSSQRVVVKDNLVDGVLTTIFDVEPGDYAVFVHHDVNDNDKMDTNFIGIPKEPTGLSNSAVAKFGPPKYKDAVFPVAEDGVQISIKLLN